jgi:NADPH:quinone reductase-like Zn-dependent oxidoreductase
MRAYRISRHGGPEVLEWVELPVPTAEAGEVVVRIRACGLNHLDLWVRRGVDGYPFPLPIIPGSEIAGDVAAVGAGVEDLQPGTPTLVAPAVSCGLCDHCLNNQDPLCRKYSILGEHRDGGYAEYVVVPRRNILSMPTGLSYVESAAIPLVFLTAWHMLVGRARLVAGEDVLIHAAGSGVSTAAIQIASLIGARKIIVTAGSKKKLAKAIQLGATDAIETNTVDFVRETRRLTGKKGVAVVVDHVGGDTFEKSLSALGWGGRIVLCGATSNHLATVNLRAVFFKSLSVLGSTMGSLGELRRVLTFIEAGKLKPVIDRTFPLEQAPEAQAVLEQRENVGKIVLEVGVSPPH